MKFHSFFIFFITFCLSFYSQKTIDTQKKFQEISAVPDSPKKVDQLISLYKKVSKKEKNVEFIIDKAISIAEKNNYTNKIAKAYSRKGINARYKFNYGKSVEYHKIALNYLENSKDTLLKIKCLNSIGVTCRKLNLEKQAFNYYFKALQLSEKFKSDKSIAIALNGIGNVFIDIEDYDKALYYFKKALLFEIKTNNVKGQEYDLANIGETYIKSGIYDSAKVYLKKSLEKSLKRDNKLSIAIKYNLLGLLYQKKEEYDTSINYYKKALSHLAQKPSKRYISNSLINLGLSELNSNPKSAFSNINEGLKIAKKVKSKENISLGYHALVEFYKKEKQYKKAMNAFEKAVAFKDSIFNQAAQKSIISTQVAYETSKKEQKIKNLTTEKEVSLKKAKTKSKQLTYTIAISIILLGGLLVLLYLFRKNSDLEIKNKNEELYSYLLQIDELKSSAKNSTLNHQKNLANNFKEFDLSKREIEVLDCISKGFTNAEMAEKLFVSQNTIKTHIKNIYSKLEVKNRVQAMKKINIIN